MARREDEPQEVVADVVVDHGGERLLALGGGERLPGLELMAELLVLAPEHLAAPEHVDRAVLRGRHEPGARIVRDAGGRPLLERRDERVLGELLGRVEVAHHARQASNQLR